MTVLQQFILENLGFPSHSILMVLYFVDHSGHIPFRSLSFDLPQLTLSHLVL